MATNRYKGFGDPIVYLDTTQDNKYLLATCD